VVAFGGILINLLTGAFATVLADSPRIHGGRSVFLAVFGMVSLCGGWPTLAWAFTTGSGIRPLRCRIPLKRQLALAPLPGRDPARRLSGCEILSQVRSLLVSRTRIRGKDPTPRSDLGITVAIYAFFYAATEQRSVAVETPKIAERRAEEEIRDERKAAEGERLRESHPEWTEEIWPGRGSGSL